MSIYSFEPGPKYRPLTPQAAWDSALSSPLGLGANLLEQGKAGALSSYVLGSSIRDALIPQGNVDRSPVQIIDALTPGIGMAKEAVRGLIQNYVNPDQPLLSEEEYKASPSYRENIPYDPGMTAARAEALASWDDARKVREHFASKRPFSSFVGNLGGQALDPVNYVPIVGPLVRAAAVARAGKIAGTALIGGLDAAANTALAAGVTFDQRGSFGDEVSWQGTISEIATAALIGGAFGTLGGAIGARSDARAVREATDRLSTLRTTQEARIALNEAIDGIVSGEDIRLSPNATEPLARVQREIVTRPPPRMAGEVDRSWAGATDLGGQTVVTPTGLRIGVKSEVVNALDLVKASGELQPRDRSRAASDAQIADMAANLDPARLMPSPEADRGAPIVGPDGIVESGNGRIAALIRAAESNPEKYAAYKQAMRDAGFNVPEEGIPVLISRRTSDLTPSQRAQFVNDANTSAIARMSATETAQMDVRAMTGSTLANYVPGDVNSAANRAFVGSFMKDLPANERAAMIDADGRLNADGIRRIENALIAAAYGDADIVARFAETPDDNVKSIMGAMSDAAGDWAAMRKEIAEGLISPEHDVTANLTDALRFLSRAREKAIAEKRPVATVIREDLGQIDLLAGDIDPRTKAFVQSFYKNDQFTQANGRDIMAEHLTNITRAARELGRPSLFGDATNVAPSEMIANARPQNRQADIFGAGSAGEGGGTNRQGGQVGTLFGDSQPDRQGSAGQLDLSPARPDPIPEGRARAEAALAKAEIYKATAEQYRVDPETGSYVEEAEIKQLEIEGRLTEQDKADLEAAAQIHENGVAYGEALRAAAGCLI